MLRQLLQCKIHKATITEADISYIGSITIDQDLLDRIDLWPGQKVTVVSNTSGNRLETYVISGPRNSGMICMNGAAALLIKKGEEVIIFSYALSDRLITPKCILVDKNNNYVQDLA
jgi:aspartate 1-decarboxylase